MVPQLGLPKNDKVSQQMLIWVSMAHITYTDVTGSDFLNFILLNSEVLGNHWVSFLIFCLEYLFIGVFLL